VDFKGASRVIGIMATMCRKYIVDVKRVRVLDSGNFPGIYMAV
jgi:hypothetical protein